MQSHNAAAEVQRMCGFATASRGCTRSAPGAHLVAAARILKSHFWIKQSRATVKPMHVSPPHSPLQTCRSPASCANMTHVQQACGQQIADMLITSAPAVSRPHTHWRDFAAAPRIMCNAMHLQMARRQTQLRCTSGPRKPGWSTCYHA